MKTKEELKTLKDLEGINEGKNADFIYVLKAEAVKRVKDCEKHIGYGIECKNARFDAHVKCDACEKFIDFFNLTSEDLK